MLLTLPPGPFAAYLFDCDGTIADSMPLQHRLDHRPRRAWLTFPEDLFYTWGGMPITGIIATLDRNQGLAMPVELVTHRKEDICSSSYRLKAVPEVLEQMTSAPARSPSP